MRIWPSTLLLLLRSAATLAAFPPRHGPACRPALWSLPSLPWAAAPLHTAICMGNLPIAVMQECQQQTRVPAGKLGSRVPSEVPPVPLNAMGLASTISLWVPVVNFRPVLATEWPRTLRSGPAQPSVQPGPAWLRTLLLSSALSPLLPCPPAALQLQLPGPGLPFLAGLDGHSLTACSELQQQQ